MAEAPGELGQGVACEAGRKKESTTARRGAPPPAPAHRPRAGGSGDRPPKPDGSSPLPREEGRLGGETPEEVSKGKRTDPERRRRRMWETERQTDRDGGTQKDAGNKIPEKDGLEE